jgi:hypothetical protein
LRGAPEPLHPGTLDPRPFDGNRRSLPTGARKTRIGIGGRPPTNPCGRYAVTGLSLDPVVLLPEQSERVDYPDDTIWLRAAGHGDVHVADHTGSDRVHVG